MAQKLKLDMPSRKEFEAAKQKFKDLKNKNADEVKKPLKRNTLMEKYSKKVENIQQVQPILSDEEPVKPEEYIEILCCGTPLEPFDNLSIVNAFFKKNQIDIKLHYRRKYFVQ